MLTAIETTGTVNEQHQLVLDESLPLDAQKRVKVIVLVEEPEQQTIAPYRKAGSAAGLIKMSDDFNEPLEDFREYMP
jgi:hypothetical protein